MWCGLEVVCVMLRYLLFVWLDFVFVTVVRVACVCLVVCGGFGFSGLVYFTVWLFVLLL